MGRAVQADAGAEGRIGDWSRVRADSASCPARQHAAGAQSRPPKVAGRRSTPVRHRADEALGRSGGGLACKIDLVGKDGLRPLAYVITPPGQWGDASRLSNVVELIRAPQPAGGHRRPRPDRLGGDEAHSRRRQKGLRLSRRGHRGLDTALAGHVSPARRYSSIRSASSGTQGKGTSGHRVAPRVEVDSEKGIQEGLRRPAAVGGDVVRDQERSGIVQAGVRRARSGPGVRPRRHEAAAARQPSELRGMLWPPLSWTGWSTAVSSGRGLGTVRLRVRGAWRARGGVPWRRSRSRPGGWCRWS